jgi:hypothetical protein
LLLIKLTRSFISAMFIDRRVYGWLQWLGYKAEDIVADDQEQEAVQLTPLFSSSLFRAHEFKEILERVSILYEIPFIKQQVLSNITLGDSPTQQQHNWELVIDFLASVGFRMDSVMIKELRTPNEMAMRGFLSDLTEFFPVITSQPSPEQPGKPGHEATLNETSRQKHSMDDKTFNDRFAESKAGPTTMVGLGKQEPHFKSNRPFIQARKSTSWTSCTSRASRT